jgi:outer membrane protein OmpA-like peptidoglycan-associated protein
MDGYKKINSFILTLVLLVVVASCTSSRMHFVNLYVDNALTETDSVEVLNERMIPIDTISVKSSQNTVERHLRTYENNSTRFELNEVVFDTTLQWAKTDNFGINETSKTTDSMYIKRILNAVEKVYDSILVLQRNVDLLEKRMVSYLKASEESIPLSHAKKEVIQKNEVQRVTTQNPKPAKVTPQKQEIIVRERTILTPVPIVVQSNSEDKNEKVSVTKNDTIQMLESTLKAVQEQAKLDSITQAVSLLNLQKKQLMDTQSDLSETLKIKNDSIRLLKRVLAQQNLSSTTKDTIIVVQTNDLKSTNEKVYDFTAYYQIGQTLPYNAFLNELIEVLQEYTISKIVLSGYTDVTGTPKINQRLTQLRIDHLFKRISPIVSVDKIFIQNFGSTFASDKPIEQERKVEIQVFVE